MNSVREGLNQALKLLVASNIWRRKLPLKKTDINVPDVTDWTLLDIADTRGNGQLDVILEGDAYEDHWFEVISVQNGSAKTIFSGLGYSL